MRTATATATARAIQPAFTSDVPFLAPRAAGCRSTEASRRAVTPVAPPVARSGAAMCRQQCMTVASARSRSQRYINASGVKTCKSGLSRGRRKTTTMATLRQWLPRARRSQSLSLPTRSVAHPRSGGGLGSAPHTAMRCGTAAIAAGEKKMALPAAPSFSRALLPRARRLLRKRQAPSGQPAAPSASAKCSRSIGS